jgi:hypothetical protein
LNYFNYFTEIEQFYQTRRESFTLLSTLDWVLIENWKEQGVPLDFVLKGIDRAFSRARRQINSLAYCIKAVEEIIEEQKEARVERPGSQQISAEETRQYLEELGEKTARSEPDISGVCCKDQCPGRIRAHCGRQQLP